MTATAGSVALSLAELERFDPNVPAAGTQHRFCCPLDACSGKPMNETHRSLCVNTATGLWKCHRCGATGKLQDFWDERKPSRLARAKRAAPSVRPRHADTPAAGDRGHVGDGLEEDRTASRHTG